MYTDMIANFDAFKCANRQKDKSYYFYPILSVVLSNLVLPWTCLVLLHIYTVRTTSIYIIVLKTGSGIIKLESLYQVFFLSRSISDMKV